MKKAVGILLVFCLCIGLCACSTGDAPSTKQTESSADNDGQTVASAFSIEDIPWDVQEGMLNGKGYILLSFSNNTDYAITEFEIEFQEKENLSAETKDSFYSDMKVLWEYDDSEMEQLKKEPISMWTRAENYYVAPGETIDNITVQYYQGGSKVSNIEHYNLLKPDVATIKYVNGDSLYTANYDFTTNKFHIDEDVILAYYWTKSPLGDMIPKPKSPVVEKRTDRDTLFSFDAFDMTLEDVNSYAEECKKLGFVVDARSYEGFYAAHNSNGYEVCVSYFEEWNMLTVDIISPDN